MGGDQPVKPNNKGPKACTTCAKAKSRCIPGPREGVCERCDRLSKPCSEQTPAPPRKRKASRPTRVAELEKRLEDLSARVESRQALPPTPSDRGSPAGPAEGHSGAPLPPPAKRSRIWVSGAAAPALGYVFGRDGSESQAKAEAEAGEDTSSRHRPSHSPVVSQKTLGVATPVLWDARDRNARSSPSYHLRQGWYFGFPHLGAAASSPGGQGNPRPVAGWPRGEEADRLLAEYREHMEPIFPFVVIPRHMDSEQLRKQRPYLWRAAMMQTLCLDVGRQLPLGNELLNDIVTSCFLQPKKSFDLLQGLEILITWFHVKLQSFQITNLLYLMRSMCASLGFSESQEAMKDQEHDSTSLEHKRAFMGVYYLVTMIFTTNKKPDAFMNTSYLEFCCRVIQEKMEYPTDELVAYLTRTQLLSQSISMTLAFRNTSLPLSMIVKSFQEQIAQLRASIPERVKKQATIKTQLHIAEILLYEVGLHEELSASLTSTERLELLWACLRATRSMLEARFEVPMVERPRQTCLASFDYTYAMLTSLRLSTLALPGWDLGLVRRELDAGKFLDVQIQEVRWLLEKRSRGAWRAEDHEGGDKGGGVVTGAGPTLDPLETLYKRLLELRVPLQAELLAAAGREGEGEGGGGAGSGQAATPGAPGAAAHLTPGGGQQPTAGAEPAVLDFMQDPEGSFWQDMYRMNEWETNFWGLDDQDALANQIAMPLRL